MVQQSVLQGPIGSVRQESVAAELCAALRSGSGGNVDLSSGVSQLLSKDYFDSRSQSPLERLSPREREVVELIVDGCATREIAEQLHSSVKTVEKQRRDAMRKLEVENVAGLVRVCLELGLKR